MAKGPCSADRSILLDYVSPFQLVALWRSLRNRDWLVSSTILIFIFLKILTVLSTGLFSLKSIPVKISGQDMILIRSFDGTKFYKAAFDMRPAFAVYGIQNLNLSYPSGTTEQYAFTEFEPRQQIALRPGSKYTTVVDVFSSSLDCEPGSLSLLNTTEYRVNVSIGEKPTNFDTIFNVNVSTSDCQIYNIPLGPPGWRSSEYWAKMQKFFCSNLSLNDTIYYRVMFSMVYFTFNGYDVPVISNSSIAVCKPTYAINSASVTLNGSSAISNLTLIDRPSRQLAGISGADLAQGVMESLHGQQGITTSLIIHDNMSYPAWTYDEVTFPEISMQDNGTLVGVTNATELDVVMPALRSVLNCTVVPQNRILDASTVTIANSATLHYDINCNPEGGEFKTNWVSEDYTTISVPIDGYFDSIFVPSKQGCPPIMLFFGQVSPNKTEHFTALTCNPYLTSIIVNAVLSLPDFSFLGNQPPIVYESSVEYYSDWQPSVELLNNGFQRVNYSTDMFTPLFQAVIYGKHGVPAVELKNNTKLIDSLEHVYRQWTAQILNANLRNSTYSVLPNRTNVPNGPWTASIKASQTRIVQSALSTRLLHAILGVLLLYAIVVFLTMDARSVLPKPPYTIAAVASLVAGSRLISEQERLFPPGIEWYTNKKLERCEIWQGKLFRMGWWDGRDGERSFRIDVKERTD